MPPYDDYYPAFAAEVKATVMSVWGLDSDHVFTSIQALKQNIVNVIAQAAETDPPIPPIIDAPLAIIQIGTLNPDDQWGLTNLAKRAPIVIWYVDRNKDRDNQATVHIKAATMVDAIDTGAFATFQSIESGYVDSSESNPANNIWLEAGLDLISACCLWSPGLLVGNFPNE